MKIQEAIEALNLLPKQLDKLTLDSFLYAGGVAVATMRKNKRNDYTDRTGALRASSSYLVLYKGKTLGTCKASPPSCKTSQASSLAAKSRAAVEAFKPDILSDKCLVVGTGMPYAYSVQHGRQLKNGRTTTPRDVIDSAEKDALKAVNDFLQEWLNNYDPKNPPPAMP